MCSVTFAYYNTAIVVFTHTHCLDSSYQALCQNILVMCSEEAWENKNCDDN